MTMRTWHARRANSSPGTVRDRRHSQRRRGAAAVAERTYDVVLIELALSGGDGLSLLAQLRRTAPTTCFIVLTGYASLESAVAALRRGAYDYLVKPCVIEDLKQTVRRAIAQRRLGLLAAQRERQLQELNDQLEARVQAHGRVDGGQSEVGRGQRGERPLPGHPVA